MDTTKEYVLMCKKAEEIQKKWKPQEGDCCYCVEVKEKVRGVDDGTREFIRQNEEIVWLFKDKEGGADLFFNYFDVQYYPYAEVFDNGYPHIWLPRQDQLQEMLNKNLSFLIYEFEYFSHCASDQKNGTYIKLNLFAFPTMEQLWLAFVMSERFSKLWNGKEWKRLEILKELEG